MRLVSFHLIHPTTVGYEAAAEAALRTLPGVSDVLIGDVYDTCSVVYDEHSVDTRRLTAVLLQAGYASKLASQAPQGSCCGSCG